jgi:hypothetical protein
LPYYPEILLLVIYPREVKTQAHTETWTNTIVHSGFIEAQACTNRRIIYSYNGGNY